MLGTTLTDTSHAFGTKGEVDPIQRSSAATTWAAIRARTRSISTTPRRRTMVRPSTSQRQKVPVDGFWSISLYNAKGYFQKNDLDAYSLNNITAKRIADGSVDIQFGGCDGKIRTACS